MYTNLLEETEFIIRKNGKRPEDVIFVGDQRMRWKTTWAVFSTKARLIDYDSGFGREYINPDLVIVGQYWWLERHEYDGSEWWEYKELPYINGYESSALVKFRADNDEDD